MTDLQEIPITDTTSFASFDSTDMYTNIPTQKVPQIIKINCDQLCTTKQLKRELIKLTRTVLKQNYFQFQNQILRQTEGLATGAPSSSILSEVFFQYTEHTVIYDILLHNNILGYFRYVYDILIRVVYDSDKTDNTDVLDSFNTPTHPMHFTVEKEQNRSISWISRSRRNTTTLHTTYAENPLLTDTIIPQT
jgi:hypothetical protein